MPKNKITDLRNHLFETIEALKDPDKPMDVKQAHAICAAAKVLIDTARVEVDFMRTVGETLGQTVEVQSEFFGHLEPRQAALPPAPLRPGGNGKRPQ